MNELNPAAAHSSSGVSAFRIYKLFTTRRGLRKFKRLTKKLISLFIRLFTGKSLIDQAYNNWLKKNTLSKQQLEAYKQNWLSWEYKPLISIILPTYNSNISFLKESIESVKNQIYTNWELCISDDASKNKEVLIYLKSLEQYSNIKIHLRKENGHISANLNSAIKLATGDYLAFLDHDDKLPTEALYEVVSFLNKEPNSDIIYSDEDKIGSDGKRFEPYFKPDWSPDTLLSRNYINHFLVIKTELLKKVNGFRKGFEGAQDHDLLLRATEKTTQIKHIARILYHWRFHSESTAATMSSKNYAGEAGIKAITEAIERRGETALVKTALGMPGNYTIRYKLKKHEKASIIIPSKDKADVLKVCLDSIIEKTTYPNFEIILLDNNSEEDSFFKLVKEYEHKLGKDFKYARIEHEFNFAYLMNTGVSKSTGEYVVLLNNDTEIITHDWLEAMMEQSQRKEIGAVGSRLLFPDHRLQHIGVIIGLGGTAGHAFVGKSDDDPGYFNNANLITNYAAVTAACLMVKKQLFTDVGGFDENLAVEYNDVDFCLKLYSKGFYNVYLPHVELYHYESLTRGHPFATKEGNERHIKETAYFESKWLAYKKHDPFFNENFNKDLPDFQLKV